MVLISKLNLCGSYRGENEINKGMFAREQAKLLDMSCAASEIEINGDINRR